MSRERLAVFCGQVDFGVKAWALTLAIGLTSRAVRGDDFPDVVCTDLDSLWVFLNDGGDGFRTPDRYFIADGVEPWSVATGDLNGDGLPEIISANRYGPHVAMFWNLGAGEFDATPRIITTPELPYDVDLGDVNGDGSLDIAVTCSYDPGAVHLLFNDGEGGFENESLLFPGGTSFNSVLVDLDGQSGLDLVVVRNGAEDLAVYLNTGDGQFDLLRYIGAGTDPKAIVASDFNSDGFADVAVANDGGGRITILLGDGEGGLVQKASYTAGLQPRELVPVNLDGDEIPDLVVVGGRGTDYVSRFLGNGDGTFRDRLDFITGPRPNSVDADDFNLDGFEDVAVANWSLDDPYLATLSILYGDGAGDFPDKEDLVPLDGFRKITALAAGQINQALFLRGDATGDGKINISDPILLLWSLFGEDTMACLDAADADDSGRLEITDAIRILNWLFLDGPQPAAPFPAVGADPKADLLGCDAWGR